MCQVIITCRSILWTLLTITTTQLLIAAVMSPQWLVGFERKPGYGNSSETYAPTIGIINRCTRLHRFQEILNRENCAIYVSDFGMPNAEFPDAWKASFVFFCVGGILLIYTMGASVMSICMQSMCGKSIFTLSGLIQSIAGGYKLYKCLTFFSHKHQLILLNSDFLFHEDSHYTGVW